MQKLYSSQNLDFQKIERTSKIRSFSDWPFQIDFFAFFHKNQGTTTKTQFFPIFLNFRFCPVMWGFLLVRWKLSSNWSEFLKCDEIIPNQLYSVYKPKSQLCHFKQVFLKMKILYFCLFCPIWLYLGLKRDFSHQNFHFLFHFWPFSKFLWPF